MAKKTPLKIGENIVPEEVAQEIVDRLTDNATDLEKVEAEMRAISPTLSELKRNNPAKYKEVYKRYMKLIEERDALTK